MSEKRGAGAEPKAGPGPGPAVWGTALVLVLVAVMPDLLGCWPWEPSHLSLDPETARALSAVTAFLAGSAYALAGPAGGIVAGYCALLLLPMGIPAWIEGSQLGVVASDVARGSILSMALGSSLGGLVYGSTRRRLPRCVMLVAMGAGLAGALAVCLATADGLRFSFFLLGLALACAVAGAVLAVDATARGRLREARDQALERTLESRASHGRDEVIRKGLKKVVFTHAGVEFACRPPAVAVSCLALGGFTAVAGAGSFLVLPLLRRVTRLPLPLLTWPALCFVLAASLGGLMGLSLGGGTKATGGWLLLVLCSGMGSLAGQWCAGLAETPAWRACFALPGVALGISLAARAASWIFA